MAIDSVRLRGADNLIDLLRALPAEVSKQGGNIVRTSVRNAAKIVQSAVLANLDAIIAEPNVGGSDLSTGTLRESIGVRRGKMDAGQKGERYRVSVKRGAKYPPEKGDGVTAAQVLRLLEYGTEKRAPMPIVRPAFEATKQQAAQSMVDEVSKRLDALIKRLDRR